MAPVAQEEQREHASQLVQGVHDHPGEVPDIESVVMGNISVKIYDTRAITWESPPAAPYAVEAPLCDPPLVDKAQVLDEMKTQGIEAPRLYGMGFPHNNCGGFCIKAGQAHFAHLLRVMPERYAFHEAKEQELRQYLDKDVAILRDRRGGTTKPLTLRDLRLRVVAEEEIDTLEWGGCGCFSPEPGA
jgi:hypothetical protein